MLRTRKGWLHRVYRQAYAVGHPHLPMEGWFAAAVKSVGHDAVLSHFAAAALWEFVDWDGRHPEVTIPRSGIRRRGIRVHRSSVLERRDVMRHLGIPVTSPARTIVDLAAVVNEKMLRSAVRGALGLRRTSIVQLVGTARRLGPRRGSARLSRVLTTAAPTRSELEELVYDLTLEAGLPTPDVNERLFIAGRRVIPDFRWPVRRVVVEADGAAWHDNPVARKDDAERQARLEVSGTQAVAKPAQTVVRLRAALEDVRG